MADTISIANNLLSVGKGALKSVAEILTALDSIGALSRLCDDEEAMSACDTISSFILRLSPSSIKPGGGTKAGMERRASTFVEGRSGRKEQGIEVLRTRLVDGVAEDEEFSGRFSLQDGRDESGAIYSTHIPTFPPPVDDYSDLLHGPRPSSKDPVALDTWKVQQAKSKPLYSILVYFPILSDQQRNVTGVEKETLSKIVLGPCGASGGSKLLTKEAYPRVRLLYQHSTTHSRGQNVALILDENPERLRGVQRQLIAKQRASWGDLDSPSLIKDVASIFVRSWGERPSILVFNCNVDIGWNYNNIHRVRSKISSIRSAPASILARALFDLYPILSRFQPDNDCGLEDGNTDSSLYRLPGGGGRVYHIPSRPNGYGECLLVFFPLFPGGSDPEELEDLAQDFVLEHSPLLFENSLMFTIDYQILYDPRDPSQRTQWST